MIDLDVVNRVMSMFLVAPTIEMDGDCRMICDPFELRAETTEEYIPIGLSKKPRKDEYFKLYNLHIADAPYISNDYTLEEALVNLAMYYAGHLAKLEREKIMNDRFAQSLVEEKEMMDKAFRDGQEYAKRTLVDERSAEDNPYPWGTDFHKNWTKGVRSWIEF